MKKFLDYDLKVVEKIEEKLIMTTTQINREYLIKAYGLGYNQLVGVQGFCALVGEVELANKLLARANKGLGDKCVCKLRRGLQITFYNH